MELHDQAAPTVEIAAVIVRGVLSLPRYVLMRILADPPRRRIARRIVSDGHEVVPAWRIGTPYGDWLILTRFDPDKPGQSDRALHLVKRFMAWRLAQSFVLAAETWLGSTVTRTGE
jgi:hypothetical protein